MINTLTLNPAIDKILYVDRFVKNVTTRIIEQKETRFIKSLFYGKRLQGFWNLFWRHRG